MSQKKDAPALLKKIRPPVATLNKKLIIVLSVLLGVIFLGILVDALNTPPPLQSAAQIKASANLNTPPSSLASLPANYSSADQIDAILSRNQGGLSPAAQHQITALQNAQQTLEQQLSALRLQNLQPNNTDSPQSQEAASSSIFFAGGAPAPTNSSMMNALDDTTNKAKASNPANAGSGDDSYQKQNMQSQKLDFLTSQPNKQIYNNNTVQYPASQYILQAGSVIPAILQTKISTNLPGMITALVSQDVYDSISGRFLLIPRGSRLIGEYNSSISFGQEQVQVKFTRLIRPDGSSILLPNQPGTTALGQSGLEDDVNNHWGRIVGSAVLSAIFNLPAIVAQQQLNQNNTTTCSNGTCTSNNSTGEVVGTSALQSAGAAASQVGTQLATQSLNIQPEVIINAGYQFSVMVSKDIVLPPYAIATDHAPSF